jgi:hypothetical protein
MGYNIDIYNEKNEEVDKREYTLRITNVSYNFSRPEYKKYWYGLNDMHNKTITEVIINMEKSICQMIKDGIKPSNLYDDTIQGFLSYLIELYKSLIIFPRNWSIKLN